MAINKKLIEYWARGINIEEKSFEKCSKGDFAVIFEFNNKVYAHPLVPGFDKEKAKNFAKNTKNLKIIDDSSMPDGMRMCEMVICSEPLK